METNLLDRMLETYMAGQESVTVTLQNKIRVSGRIKAFDSYVIIMEGQRWEILYRHAISSITATAAHEHKQKPLATKPAPVRFSPAKTAVPSSQQPRSAQPQMLSPAGEAQNINDSMKDALLRWMHEQKTAK